MMEMLISPTLNMENKIVKQEGAGSTQMISNQKKASKDDVVDDKMQNDQQNDQLDFNFAKQPDEIIREPQSKISSSSLRSPRCEAFLMTGDKMLNLNPKISPCYAKICQNQLPPAVEVDSFEQHKITPTKKTRLDQFPSMQKNEMHKNKDTSLTGDDANLDLLMENNSSKTNENLEPLIFDESIGANIVPADPTDKRYYQSTSATLQQNNLSEISDMDPAIQIVRSSKSAQINRFIASQSQSTPNSPAHLFQQFASQNIDSKLLNHESNDLFSHVQSIYSSETITRLARHLFTHQEGIKIAAFLVKSDELSIRIAREFVSLFNFAGIRVDIALRTFLSHVCLPTGESSERAQLLEHYAHRYHECNLTVFNSADEIHPLTCALLFLNSDLHGKQNGKKMSCRDFIENLSRTDFKYSPALLKELYLAVKEKPFYYKAGEELIKPTSPVSEFGLGREKTSSRIIKKKGSISSTMLINPEHQVDYKHGWLKKKSIYDSDGSKTPLGRRKWTMLYGTVRGMVLYLHENENSFSSGQYFTFRNCILLHHSLAEVARDYTKKKNIFRLRTANLGEFLFQTSDPAEVQKWVDILNYVAAAFSAPALPTPVASNGVITFYRPNLPSTSTHFPMVEQLRAHEQRLEETTTNLAHLRENAPPMKSKGKIVYDYFYKERFLDKERERYKIYTEILREKLARTSSIIRCESQSAANTNF